MSRKRTILVGDDDSSGLIYAPMYFHYMSEGDSELFDRLAHPTWQQVREGIACPVVHASCDYVSAARAGDALEQHVCLSLGRRSSFTTTHVFTSPETSDVVATGHFVRAWVRTSDMALQPIPQWLRPRD